MNIKCIIKDYLVNMILNIMMYIVSFLYGIFIPLLPIHTYIMCRDGYSEINVKRMIKYGMYSYITYIFVICFLIEKNEYNLLFMAGSFIFLLLFVCLWYKLGRYI